MIIKHPCYNCIAFPTLRDFLILIYSPTLEYTDTCVHIYIVKVLLGKRHTRKLLVAWKLRTLYVTSWELDGESDPQVILFVFLNIMSVTLINLF